MAGSGRTKVDFPIHIQCQDRRCWTEKCIKIGAISEFDPCTRFMKSSLDLWHFVLYLRNQASYEFGPVYFLFPTKQVLIWYFTQHDGSLFNFYIYTFWNSLSVQTTSQLCLHSIFESKIINKINEAWLISLDFTHLRSLSLYRLCQKKTYNRIFIPGKNWSLIRGQVCIHFKGN